MKTGSLRIVLYVAICTWVAQGNPTEDTLLGEELIRSPNFTEHEFYQHNFTLDNNDTDLAEPAFNNQQSSRSTFNRVQFFIRKIYFPLITLLSLIGNSIIITVLVRTVTSSSSGTYLLGLAVADLLFSIFFAPTIFRHYEVIKNTRSFGNFYSYYVCYFFPFVNIFHTVAVWVTVTFTIERLFAVAFPVQGLRFFTKRRSTISVTIAFLFGFVLNFYRFFRRIVIVLEDPVTGETYNGYTLSNITRTPGVENAYFWLYFFATKGLPFPILVALNSCVLWNLWRARIIRIKISSATHIRPTKGNSRENQITRILIAIVVAFLVCNAMAGGASLYVALYGTASLSRSPELWVLYLFGIGEALINSNPLVNCILYTACSKAVRNEIKALFCQRLRMNTTELTKPTTITEQPDDPKDFSTL